ncbi:hypothetical protein TNIN_205841 [Trichonephila inaurata madagascariensis]|uniref:Uncharacterized protein n=1 Tax=Trichonephila inaurata madagascariensis TaxID=2747483 RepID=A0A8X6X8S1_9ARAC|nr:hypothetical protein TNIN_205841 [Trichonephila inaurata madagascariensis]
MVFICVKHIVVESFSFKFQVKQDMSLKTLYRLIDSSKDVVVRCPLCFESMTFGHYYHQHALKEHSLKNRKECVFCMGLKSWPHGQRMKPENVTHVLACLKDFVAHRKMMAVRITVTTLKAPRANANISSRYLTTRSRLRAYVCKFYDSVLKPTCGLVD